MNKIDLQGRAAIVTGGAQGIGLAIAKRMLASGASVRIWDRDRKLLQQALSALSGPVSGDAVDVADAESVAQGTAAAAAALGKIDILVNNAGIAGVNAPTVDYPVDEWERVLKVNLTGQFLCCRAIAPHMVKQKYGRIINIASIAGKEGNPNAVAYSASKAGVISLTKSLGKELAKDGVGVNCITPAAAKTAIFDQMTEEHINYMLAKIPMGRFVLVEEIAAMACWLASEECSFTTSGVFDISGGRATY
ncbi:MAG TPA: SDR family NAD(P)-dependent oxidoreductase [Burkholderiales bacterium]|nr:SDR family NAD(P)-dependent oxidoreductase [Burkholderiales bacterium]